MIRPVPHVAAMSPYALATLNAPAGKRLISLAQNESLRPPGPRVIAAVQEVLETGHLYPDPDWTALRAALSQRHGIPAEDIVCGAGSMDLISGITMAYADVRNAVLAPAHAYPFFRTAAQRTGARFDTAPETQAGVSVRALVAAVRPDTRVVFIANPGNPTGTRIPREELLWLRDALPRDVLLVIDEAYGEFADHLNEPMFDLVDRGDTVVLRTFSKAFGLAGFRVGWGAFPPDVAGELRKVTNPNTVSAPAQAAAQAALADQAYMRDTCRLTADLRDGFIARLRPSGFDVPDSFTNFALIRFATDEQAGRADRALRQEGVFLRPQGGVGLGACLRATIGAARDLDTAAEILENFARKEMP